MLRSRRLLSSVLIPAGALAGSVAFGMRAGNNNNKAFCAGFDTKVCAVCPVCTRQTINEFPQNHGELLYDQGLPDVLTRLPNAAGQVSDTTLYLVGVGMRKKSFWVVEVDVYMTGFSLSKPAELHARQWRTEDPNSSKTLAAVIHDFDDKKAKDTPKACVSLNFVRSVTTPQIVEAFNDAFHDLDPVEVAKFKSALNDSVGLNGMNKGEVVCFVFMNGGGILFTVHGHSKQIIRSEVLEKRMLEVYMDPKYTVSKQLLESTLQNLADPSTMSH
jgi:hypothetical protein